MILLVSNVYLKLQVLKTQVAMETVDPVFNETFRVKVGEVVNKNNQLLLNMAQTSWHHFNSSHVKTKYHFFV